MKPRSGWGNRVGGGVLNEMRKGEGGANLWGDEPCVGHMRLEVTYRTSGCVRGASSQFD